jgi:ribosomal-protein-alanine N-acetyltransferase
METRRLRLREIVADDAPMLFAIHGDAELMRWYGVDPLPDIAAASKLIDGFANLRGLANPGTRWGVQRKGKSELIGSCGLFGWNRAWRKCTVVYELAAQAQGSGYMHEALSAVFSWGFEHMRLNRIEAQIHPENTASIRLARRLGFVEEGCLRQAGYWRGGYHDLLLLSLLRSAWPAATGETL